MSHVASVHGAVEPAESPLTPESWGKLGMWIFLAGDAVGFGTLLAGYGMMRATSGDWPSPYEVLGINLTAAMTFLLICSSVTMVKGLEWLGKGDKGRAKAYLFYTAQGPTGDIVWRVPAQGGTSTPWVPGAAPGDSDSEPELSPDGTRLVFTRRHHGDCDLWMLAGGVAQALVTNPLGQDAHADWSSDSRRLVFETGGAFNLYRADVRPLLLR